MIAVIDRGVETEDRSTLVTEQLGRTRWLTPQGYLFCEGVKVARTGPMMYLPEEVPGIDAGGQTMVTMLREAEALFSPETISSFAGMSVTVDHPDEMLDPDNTQKKRCRGCFKSTPRRSGRVRLSALRFADQASVRNRRHTFRQVARNIVRL